MTSKSKLNHSRRIVILNTEMSRTNSIIVLAFLPLTTGIGLVVYILSGVSLPLATAFVGVFAFATAWAVWRRTPLVIRPMLKHRAIIGFLAGIVATIAYDLCRFVFVKLLNLAFWPFDIFTIFGRLLVGDGAPGSVAVSAGALFHYANGIGFALGFVFLFRRPSLFKGLLWAAVLELFMVSLYPGWLGLKALNDFFSVSILGHTAYGLVLGGISQKSLAHNLTLPQDQTIRRISSGQVN